MSKEIKNLFLLTSSDIKRIRKLVRHLDRALRELVELKRVTTFDDEREFYPPHESDLIEQASFIEHKLRFRLNKENQDF